MTTKNAPETRRPRFIVDEEGTVTDIVLDIKVYEEMCSLLEDADLVEYEETKEE